MKGVGRIYQQTFLDTYSKVAFAKLYDRKTPITAADLLNDRMVPFFDAHEVKLSRVLTGVTAWRRAGSEVSVPPRSLYRRTSFAASVRTFFGPRGFQPATKRA